MLYDTSYKNNIEQDVQQVQQSQVAFFTGPMDDRRNLISDPLNEARRTGPCR